jgi:muramoyltetrapeptide carboxypeptidase
VMPTEVVFPPKLGPGSHIRVIAPSGSRAAIGEANRPIVDARMAELGLTVSFGAHVDDSGPFGTAPVGARLADFHEAFADPSVDGVMTVIGGYHANDLLPGVDWDIVARHPKVLCGYSDITALQGAILARTGLVTYSGPHWSSFGMRDHFDEVESSFVACLFDDAPIALAPAAEWFDDQWYLHQDDRQGEANEGWWALRPGGGAGRIVGGNLCTLNLLQGTPNMPSLDGAVLFIEDDFESHPSTFRRDLVSLFQVDDAAGIVAVVIGRFQRASAMTRTLLGELIDDMPHLRPLPVVANVDFGHTFPLITFPVGGDAVVEVGGPTPSIVLTRH